MSHSRWARTSAFRRAWTRSPTLEALEDRTVPSFVPLGADHYYDLNGSLADSKGGPALVADGGVLGSARYDFSANHGLRLTGALADPGTYSLVLSLSVAPGGFYKKLVDFQNRASDNGLYLAGTSLLLYPGAGGPTPVALNTDFQMIVARSGASGETRVYLNGVLQQTYTGAASSAALPSGNVLTFFEDDLQTGGSESVTGSIDYLAVYNRALTAGEIAGAVNHAPAVTVNQPVVTVGEGETARVTGTWSDADLNPVTLSATAGTLVQNANGTWSWSLATNDGPDDSRTVVITATDSHGASASTSFSLAVTNLAPMVAAGTGSGVLPSHLYLLDGSLADHLGGPGLTADGGVLGASSYAFSANGGLRLAGALADPANYTIVMSLSIDLQTGFFKKLVDFHDRSIDTGLYVTGSVVALFPGGAGTGLVAHNTPFTVALTRSGPTGETRLYLNGVLQQTYTGQLSNSAIPANNLLTFFEDDLATRGGESSTGVVDYIALFDRPLSAPEVAGFSLAALGDAEVEVGEGETAVNHGSWSDPGRDVVDLAASVGTVTMNQDGTWSWEWATNDGPEDSQTVLITATDSDGASGVTSFRLVVNNLAPHLATDAEQLAANEGDVARVGGTWGDPGDDAVTLAASVGAVTAHADGTWSWEWATSDGPGDSQNVVITATDSDGAASSTEFALDVNNVAPEITGLAANFSSADNPSRDGRVAIRGTFTDPGLTDVHTVLIDWGDGTPPTAAVVDEASGTFAATHHFATGGLFPIRATLADGDGGVATKAAQATVTGVGLVGGTLYVVGTPGKDDIAVDLVSVSSGKKEKQRLLQVQAKFDMAARQPQKVSVTFTLDQVQRIVILPGPGTDQVRIARDVPYTVVVEDPPDRGSAAWLKAFDALEAALAGWLKRHGRSSWWR